MMFMFHFMFREDLCKTFRRVVATPVARSLRPIEYGPNALLYASRSLRLVHPDGRQCLQYVGGIYQVNRFGTKDRKCVDLQGRQPLRRVLPIAERLGVFRMYLSCCLLERRHSPTLLPPRREWIAAGSPHLPPLQSLFAGFGDGYT